jgi:hypothetical protein
MIALHRCLSLAVVLSLAVGWAAAEDTPLSKEQEALVRRTVWGQPTERQQAIAELSRLPGTAAQVRRAVEIIRAGRAYQPIKEAKTSLTVNIGVDKQLTVNVLVPPGYDPAKHYPLMLAMGGGPTANDKQAKAQAAMMLGVWSKPASEAGWIVAAIEDTVSIRHPGKNLRYSILHADHVSPILTAIQAKYAVDPNRRHSTGISLGSNYSLVYAAAHPDWFAGIVPVSTEGESREHVLRNLNRVGVYTLEGAKDKNIRSIEGPRAMTKILDALGYRHRYEEDPNQAHEGFFNKYPAVLKWLAEQPRDPFPRDVIRLPHQGIVIPDKRFFWIEGDTHQAAFQASVRGNTITINAARVRRLTLHLADPLLNLDEPVIVRVNGVTVHDKKADRSLSVVLHDASGIEDTERFAVARLVVDVPELAAGEKWLATLAPKVAPGLLAFWEDFAVMTLKESRARVPADIEQITQGMPTGFAGLRVMAAPVKSLFQPGDVIVGFDDEPFFAAGDGVRFLRDYLWRATGKAVRLKLLRDGQTQEITLPLKD